MATNFVPPKGRMTIRRRAPGSDQRSRHVGLWDLASQPGSTIASLEAAYGSL